MTRTSRNAYSVLKIRADASEESVERAYQMRLIEVQTNMRLSGEQKNIEIVDIEEANRILSRRASRASYDLTLANENDAADEPANSSTTRNKIVVLVLVIAVAAGAFFWLNQREAERQRINVERAVAEAKAAEALLTAEKTRLKFEEQQRLDAIERRANEEARLTEARAAREQEMQAEKFVALPLAVPQKSAAEINRENMRKEINQIIQQRENDRVVRQSQLEIERQRRFLQQLEDEDKAAREARARAANPDSKNPRQ